MFDITTLLSTCIFFTLVLQLTEHQLFKILASKPQDSIGLLLDSVFLQEVV